jgi:hypothetical protein
MVGYRERITAVYISVAYSRTHGLLTWWEADEPGNDNDEPGGATPIAITEPPGDGREPIKEPPHQLWLSPRAVRQVWPHHPLFTPS